MAPSRSPRPGTVTRVALTVVALGALVVACSASAQPTAPVASSAAAVATPTTAPATAPATAPSTTPSVVTQPPTTPSPTFGPSMEASTARPEIATGESWLLYRWYPKSLFLVRPDGSDRHRLDLGVPGEPVAMSWSPDGERIAFALRDDATPNGSIWTANADGTDAKQLYNGCSDSTYWPSWSPDGRKLAVICYDVSDAVPNGIARLSILDAKTLERTDLVSYAWPQFLDNPPSWSPDGSAIAFDILTWDPTNTFLESSVIATVPSTGGKPTTLTDPTMFGAHPDWSPDGSTLLFNTYDTGNMHGIKQPSNVYLIAPDGTGLRQLSTASVDGKMRLGQPSWSADGTRIWVSVGRDWEKDSTGQFRNTLAWVDATTGELHEIGTEGKGFVERPATR